MALGVLNGRLHLSYGLLVCGNTPTFSPLYQTPSLLFNNISLTLNISADLQSLFTWNTKQVRCNHIENQFLRSLAHGPLISAKCYPVYFINGYKFHTEYHGSARSTINSGVCISDPNIGDYYGRIQEIIQVEYREEPLKQTVLFKCEWFDPTVNVGVKEHNKYKLVDVNHRRRFRKYEPFILAMQATQVCYVPYPSTKKDNDDWVAVLKVKLPDVIELLDEAITSIPEPNFPFQVEEVEVHLIDMNFITNENIILHDPNGDVIEMVEPIDDGLLIEYQEFEEESSEDEYETEDENEEDDEEEFEEETNDD
ncbi:uncharacterized protein [Nicotiana tomentosiformis]|uniref:uncharacterized protein n=1 Tax=Nicotiana tomentosiformis TaxID=4098 RepID=UPI00388C9BCB